MTDLGLYDFEEKNINVSKKDIISHSANNHIVPSPDDTDVRNILLGIHRGDAVHLSGYLIQISAPDGWHWNSSRSQTDTGDHSCELFYVTEARILE